MRLNLFRLLVFLLNDLDGPAATSVFQASAGKANGK